MVATVIKSSYNLAQYQGYVSVCLGLLAQLLAAFKTQARPGFYKRWLCGTPGWIGSLEFEDTVYNT